MEFDRTVKQVVNTTGQVQCWGCQNYSDIVRPVLVRRPAPEVMGMAAPEWTSFLCGPCMMDTKHGDLKIEGAGDPIDVKRYKGALEQSASRATSDIRAPPPPS